MLDLDKELRRKFRQQFIGETAGILLENSGRQVFGRCERYFMVYLEKTQDKLQKNDIVKVKFVKNSENGAIGQLIERRIRRRISGLKWSSGGRNLTCF